MLEAIIDFINLKLELTNYFEKRHCLTSLVKNETSEGELIYPAEYLSGGDFDKVDFDAYDGVSYLRVNGDIDVSRTDENRYTPSPRVDVTIPLRLVYAVRKEKLTVDDAYSFDRVRGTIVKQLEVDAQDLVNQLNVDKVTISTNGYKVDAQEIWSEETNETGLFQPKFELVFGSMEVSVTVRAKANCIPTECDDVESDILKTFNFCSQVTQQRLTQTQVDCLTAWLCGAADPVTIQINGVTYTTANAGDTFNQQIQNSNSTPIGTAANPSIIADASVSINSTPVDTVEAEGSLDLTVNLDGSPSGSWNGSSWEVTSAACADATVNVNGVFMDTIPSGGSENIQVRQETGATLVGSKQGQYWRIDDSQAQVNGVDTETIAATETHNQVIENTGGVAVGTAANPSIVANSPIEFNGSSVDQVKAEDTYSFIVKLDGVNSGTYDAPTKTVNVTSSPPSLAVTFYSDAGLTNPITDADFGDTVYINAVATGITPTSYRFFVKDSIDYVLTEQAGATLSKTISTFEDVCVYVEAIDATNATCEREVTVLTINSDADATAFIAAHNAISGTTMGAVQQTAVETFFLNLKGFGTTNGSDIWTIAHNDPDSRIFPLVPITDATTSFDVYQLDAVHLATGTYNNFVLGDLSVNGVTGGGTKYFDAGVSPNDLPQNDVSVHYYSRTNVEGNYRDVGASDASSYSTKQFSITANRSGNYRIDLNATGTLTNIAGASDTRGTYSGVRDASNSTILYKDGASVGSSSTASVTPTTSNLYFHSHNQGGSLFQSSIRQLSFYAIMPSLDANEIADLEEAIVNLQTNVITGGRNV